MAWLPEKATTSLWHQLFSETQKQKKLLLARNFLHSMRVLLNIGTSGERIGELAKYIGIADVGTDCIIVEIDRYHLYYFKSLKTIKKTRFLKLVFYISFTHNSNETIIVREVYKF